MDRKKGLSLVELMIVIGISTIALSLLFTTYVTAHRVWKGGFTSITFQSRGRIAVSRISRELRSATEGVILNAGTKVRFTIDPNNTSETITDDITCEYYVTGQNLMYDPDISIAGNEVVMLSNVFQEPGVSFFQMTGNMVVVTFKLFNSNILYGTKWASLGVSVKMRNV